MTLFRTLKLSLILTVGIGLTGCAEAVFLAELFTDIDEQIADDIRQDGEIGIFSAYDAPSPFLDDDALRFPNAQSDCQAYGQELKASSGGLLEQEYLRAMKSANCRAQ